MPYKSSLGFHPRFKRLSYTCGLLLLSLLAAPASLAFDTEREFFEKTQQLTRELDRINKQSDACDLDKTPLQCHSSSICTHMKPDGFYSFTDRENRKTLNLHMIVAAQNYQLCAKGFAGNFDDEPFLFTDKLFDERIAGGAEKLKQNQQRFSQEMKRAEKVFKDVRLNMIKQLESKKDVQNSREIDFLIKKINSVKFMTYTPQDLEQGKSLLALCDMPNAFYSSRINTVAICPQWLGVSEGALFYTLAHELGHSIDMCNINFAQSKEGLNIPEILPEAPQGPVLTPGIEPAKNPLKKAYACLANSDLNHYKSFEKREWQSTFQDLINRNPSEAAANRPFFSYIENNFDKIKYCTEISSRGQEQEASADWLATETVAQKLKAIPDASSKKEFSFAASTIVGDFCTQIVDKVQSLASQAGQNNQCASLTNQAKHLDLLKNKGSATHPSNYNRVNKIILAHPEVQKSLACKGSAEATRCE